MPSASELAATQVIHRVAANARLTCALPIANAFLCCKHGLFIKIFSAKGLVKFNFKKCS